MRVFRKSDITAAFDLRAKLKLIGKLTLAVTLLTTLLASGLSASAETSLPPSCEPKVPGGPVRITSECIDPLYNNPVIDSVMDLTIPVPVHKVSGHFEGTTKKFNFYFPPKDQWQGRFFHQVYPLITEEAEENIISYGADSGAYTVQTNGGSGYRVEAAAAKFSKIVAAQYYGLTSSDRIYGYIWGGSGGSFMTISAIENASGVWDGAVPFIPSTPTSLPNNFLIRGFARFVLTDKALQIADAVSPGGSGDPYASLNEVEKSVLQEVTKLGVPLRGWMDNKYILGLNDPNAFLGYQNMVKAFDPTYADDFWSKPGYLGTEQSGLGNLFRAARINQTVTINAVTRNSEDIPTSLTVDQAPANLKYPNPEFTLYSSTGLKIGALNGSLDPLTKVFTLADGNQDSVLNAISNATQLQIDNKWSLALLSYHRHQVPKQQDFTAWDQFRAADGTPIYPQRSIEVGPTIASSVTGGGTYTGAINGKVILVTNLLDVDAYPWDGDWYRKRVQASLGPGYIDNFRIWYNDYADHVGPHNSFLIDYMGILEQALRDVSAWVEYGVTPPNSTNYEVVDNQVHIPENAALRQGIQPVIDLTVNGALKTQISIGQHVDFTANVNLPPISGEIVSAEWDLEGNGNFTALPGDSPAVNVISSTYTYSTTFTYSKPGIYFPALRVTTQREGNKDTVFARIQNLGRARVVVQDLENNEGTSPVVVTQPPQNNEPKITKLNASGYATMTVDIETFNKAHMAPDYVSINFPIVDEAGGYEITFPSNVLKGKKTFEITTELGTIKLPSAMFSATELQGTNNVTLTLRKATTDDLNQSVLSSVGDRPILEVTLKLDDVAKPWNNPNAPVTLFIPYKPKAFELDASEHIVVWSIDNNGAAVTVPTGRYDAGRGGIQFKTTHFSKFTMSFVTKTFSDIEKQTWAKQAIEVLSSKGIISGTSASTFTPEAGIKRADFIFMLVNALGFSAKTVDNFADVSPNVYYADSLAVAKKLGIAQGFGGNRFNPEALIARQDMMVIIDKAMSIADMNIAKGSAADLNTFSDRASIAPYAKSSIATLYKNSIMTGNSGKVNPSLPATRAEAAVLIYRVYNINSN
ncbi:S-layer homology domain-containing protein [Paenibacillus graminis]|uniref:S-layer homology domain-containing protein n=1 Tax=Paenibacillus graminis TaxID=189425 RepID=UPI00047192CE|nr:S-layer homology domain-containing protein [Paenibacillus graminis]